MAANITGITPTGARFYAVFVDTESAPPYRVSIVECIAVGVDERGVPVPAGVVQASARDTWQPSRFNSSATVDVDLQALRRERRREFLRRG